MCGETFGTMPKKKTGARKKAEKQKQRQKEIKAASESKSIVMSPCNAIMVSPAAVRHVQRVSILFCRNVTSVKGKHCVHIVFSIYCD